MGKCMILILGRTGVGKDTVANMLSSKYGLKQVIPYTTRPRSKEGETNHFISSEEVDKYDKVVETKIGDYIYFTTPEQIENCDIYIIDPIEMYSLMKKYPDKKFFLVYITANENKARKKYVKRGYPLVEERLFNIRRKEEKYEFDNFERDLPFCNFAKYKGKYSYHIIYNDFIIDHLPFQIDTIYHYYKIINENQEETDNNY